MNMGHVFGYNTRGVLCLLSAAICVVLGRAEDAATPPKPAHFSGVYNPTCKQGLEVFGGAWLMHASRFRLPETLEAIDRINFIEAHTFFVAMGNGKSVPTSETCEDMTKHMIMTRDYFDFLVEHLSSTLNIAESDDINPLLLNRTAIKASHLKAVALVKHPKIHYFHDVVVVIPFAMQSGLQNSANSIITQKIRLLFFESTFWSLYRYFPRIVVSVTRKRDYNGLMSLNLPLFHVFTTFDKEKNQGVHYNVRTALSKTHEMMNNNLTWDSLFRFVYFSEGDSILHMRNQKHLYELLAAPKFEGELILTPHRMQTMPIPHNLPEESRSIPKWKRQALQDAQLVTEDGTTAVGSCCDDGRYAFKDCGNWWYNCHEYGLADLKTWLRFGKNGFTMSLTEHKGRCAYSPVRVRCAVPVECSYENSEHPADISLICREVPSVSSSNPSVPSQSFARSNQEVISRISNAMKNAPKISAIN